MGRMEVVGGLHMKRRSFLQAVGAAVAALFVPTVAARQSAPAMPVFLTGPDAWHIIEKPDGGRTLWVNSATAMFGYGHGTFNHPFATIREAQNVANPSDVIVLKSTHYEKIVSESSLRIVSRAPIVDRDDVRVKINFS